MFAPLVARPAAKSQPATSRAPAGPAERPTWQRPAITLGRADDPLEADAAAVAERMTPVPAAPAPAVPDACAAAAPAAVHEALRSPGQPLDRATRAFMEPRLGYDFGRVRIHSDPAAARSATAIGARAYAAGDHVVFAPGQFAPASPGGRALLAHELTHVVQQPGPARVVRRQLARDPAPTAPAKAQEGPTADDFIWALETLRVRSPRDFVKFLAKNEGTFYPLLRPYGFRGSWVKEDDYLADFDAAISRWPKLVDYLQKFGPPRAAAPAPRRKTREERQYEDAQMLVVELNRHGHTRSEVNDELESTGLLDDLERHGFEKAGRWSFTNSEVYGQRAVRALNAWIDRYRAAHGLGTGATASVPTQGENVEFYRAWLEGLESVSGSFLGAVSAGIAMEFTDDPKKIAAAAQFGATIEGAATAHIIARTSGPPQVVTRRNVPGAVDPSRYTGPQPLEPVRDPAKVAEPPVRDPIPPPRADEPVRPPTAPPRVEPERPPPAVEPTRGDVPAKPAVKPSRRRKNPPIDSKRQVEAKNRLEQTKTEHHLASREEAAAGQRLESAQARVKQLTDDRRPVPPRLESVRRAMLREMTPDVEDRLARRLEVLEEARGSRTDWSADERDWLDHEAALLDAQLDVEAARAGRAKQAEAVRDTEIMEPVRKDELARASKSVAGLIRSTGPNYRALTTRGNVDEVMGEQAWNELKARRPKGSRPLALNTDHIVSVRELRDMVVASGLLEVHEKASLAVKVQIEDAIRNLGDERDNLVRMESVTNQKVKSDRSWVDIRYDEVARYYTPEMVDKMRTRETKRREAYRSMIQQLVTDFKK